MCDSAAIMRLKDEIMEVGVSLPNSPNLRDLMEEQEEDEIRPVAERQRQTMGSILSISDQEVVGKTLWEVIQEEEQSKPKEGRILKNVLRFRFRREESEIREKEGEQRKSESETAVDEEIGLLESWGAAERSPRSPAVVDSARLHMQDSRLARLESAAVRVYLVGGSNPVADQTMDGINRRWRALKHRLRFRKFACCGSNWTSAAAAERSSFSNLSSTSVMLPHEEDDEEDQISWNGGAGGEIDPTPEQNPSNNSISTSTNATETENDTRLENDDHSVETCVSALVTDTGAEERSVAEPRRAQLITLFGRNFEPAVVTEEDGAQIHVGMNLAAALAAERQLRAAQEWDLTARTSTSTATSTSPGVSNLGRPTRGTSPFRVSLMSLLEESDDRAVATARSNNSALFSEEWDSKEAGGVGEDPLCCVCMVRRKGAAFIPCGHTFCRLCTRELWVSRGSCPLCNRYIMEILDIF